MNSPDSPDTSVAYQVQEKLASLEEALLQKLPTIPTLLRDIHRHLKKDPQIVTVLKDEEVATVIEALKVQTKTEISTKVAKKKATKALSKLTLDDL